MPGDETQLTCGARDARFASRADRAGRMRSAGIGSPRPTGCPKPTLLMAMTVVGILAFGVGRGGPGNHRLTASEPAQPPADGRDGDARPAADRRRVGTADAPGPEVPVGEPVPAGEASAPNGRGRGDAVPQDAVPEDAASPDRPRMRMAPGSGGQPLRPGDPLNVVFLCEQASSQPMGGETLPNDHRWRVTLRRVADGQIVEPSIPFTVDPDPYVDPDPHVDGEADGEADDTPAVGEGRKASDRAATPGPLASGLPVRQDEPGRGKAGPVRWRVRGVSPERPGVYELQCALERRHDRGWPLWRRVTTTIMDATCPLVVLPAGSPPNRDTRDGRLALIQVAGPDWPAGWAGDADDANGSVAFSDDSLALHQAWLAASRLADRCRLIGAHGVVIPGGVADPRATELALAVLAAQGRSTLVAMPVVPVASRALQEWASLVERLGRHRGFGGLVIDDAGSMVAADSLRPLVNSLAGRRLIVMADSAEPDDGPKDGDGPEDGGAIDVVGKLLALATSSGTRSLRGIGFSAIPERSLHRHLAWHRQVVAVMDGADRQSGHHRCLRFPPVALAPEATDGPGASAAIGEIGEAYSLRVLGRLIHRLDPAVILLPVGPQRPLGPETEPDSDAWSRLLGEFGRMPSEMGEIRLPSDPADRTVGLRLRRDEDAMTLAFTNLAPWPVDVEATFATAVALRLAGDANERPAGGGSRVKVEAGGDGRGAATDISMERRKLRLTLRRGDTRVVTVTGERPKLQGWSTRPSGGQAALKAIHSDVSAIFERLGTLSLPPDYPGLTNGDFEVVAEGGLTGWLHAQFPADAVRVDVGEASSGGRSVYLANSPRSDNRAWLVSEPVPTPASGRLAVSLAYRAESNPAETDHRLRVSLEGSGSGGPFKRSAELAVPRNGLWQSRRLVLEAVDIDPDEIPTLRVTIDSLSSGPIWVDDIRLHDRFATAPEREEIRGQAFLAVQGLRRADLTPACHLLQNFWAGRLLAEAPMASGPEASEADPPANGGRGVAKKLRDWLPRPLRF